MIIRPLSKIKDLFKLRFVPIVIWIITMSVVLYLWSDVGQSSPIIGFVLGTEHRLAATHPGKIQRLAVSIGQQVSTGQVVAMLDTREIEAEIRIEQAELERIKVAIAATGVKEKLKLLATQRQFAQASEGATISLAKAQAEFRAKSIELDTLTAKRKELSELLAKGMLVKRDLINLEVRHAALENEVRAADTTIKLLQQEVSSSQARRKALPENSIDASVAPLKAEFNVAERRLERLIEQRDSMTLRAPCGGKVAKILLQEGDVAQEGQSVISIIGEASDRVLACVYENQAPSLKIGTEANLYSRLGESKSLKGQVVALGPVIHELPIRCRPQPGQPAWGREIVILLDKTPSTLVAGEAFNIRLKESGIAISRPAVAAPSPAQSNHPDLIQVPKALKIASRFEPSGLIWIPKLSRYVIVSDDTGQPDHGDHIPWLFTMDSHGRVDQEPLRVEGMDKLNDLESIAQGPNSVLYVLSSQSYSKKGKRKPSRQAFYRLVPSAGGYAAGGSVSLAELLDAADKQTLHSLGIEDTRNLNIEGMTAIEGGLLIGLKAPLDPQGNAIIWKLSNPERLITSGKLEDAGLSIWGKVKLEVEADGHPVPGGIAEILELPDGSLVIAATASGIKPKQQTGSIWHIPRPFNRDKQLPAKKIRSFPGLKPEGLALSPKPGHLTVVFDADRKNPAWIELTWPQ